MNASTTLTNLLAAVIGFSLLMGALALAAPERVDGGTATIEATSAQ